MELSEKQAEEGLVDEAQALLAEVSTLRSRVCPALATAATMDSARHCDIKKWLGRWNLSCFMFLLPVVRALFCEADNPPPPRPLGIWHLCGSG